MRYIKKFEGRTFNNGLTQEDVDYIQDLFRDIQDRYNVAMTDNFDEHHPFDYPHLSNVGDVICKIAAQYFSNEIISIRFRIKWLIDMDDVGFDSDGAIKISRTDNDLRTDLYTFLKRLKTIYEMDEDNTLFGRDDEGVVRYNARIYRKK